MSNYQYYIFFFVIYIIRIIYKKFSREIFFLYNNKNYIDNFFVFNKCKSIILSSCYIIHDKDDKKRKSNLEKIKSQIDVECKIHEGIFPNKGDWDNLYNEYSLLYPLLKTNDFRAHGCFLSHITLIEKIFDGDDDYVLILEDNVDIIRKIPHKIVVPKDFDILSLEEDRLGGIYYNSSLIRVTNGCGACGYIVNVKSICSILSKLQKTNLPIDLAYIELSYKNLIKMYKLKESYLKRSKDISTIRENYKVTNLIN
jgi:hypothetical protein